MAHFQSQSYCLGWRKYTQRAKTRRFERECQEWSQEWTKSAQVILTVVVPIKSLQHLAHILGNVNPPATIRNLFMVVYRLTQGTVLAQSQSHVLPQLDHRAV